jgi:hypothetical protein
VVAPQQGVERAAVAGLGGGDEAAVVVGGIDGQEE